MPAIAARRSAMTLYSQPQDPQSHRTRIVLSEKDITVDVIDSRADALPEDVLEMNPTGVLPALVDRDLILYESRVIMEYLDERFPHPPLMPVDPVSRAKSRLALHRIEQDWYGLVAELEGKSERAAARARKGLRESLASSVELFNIKPFFLNDEFSLLDCSIGPILWRLPHWGIELPAPARSIIDYAERLFQRPSFQASLSEAEREMRL